MWADAQPRVVLVVEDDWLLRSGIVIEFQSAGWLVLDTASGEEAVNLAFDTPVDAVFTDIQLAGPIDGWGWQRGCDGQPRACRSFTPPRTRPTGQGKSRKAAFLTNPMCPRP
jgi:CheY-like chemotaxis protein